MKRRSNRMKKQKRVAKIVLCVLLAIVLVFGGTFGALYFMGKKQLETDEPEIIVPDDINADLLDNGNTIVYNGHKYRFNNSVTSALVLGIDKDDLDNTYKSGYNGQADAIFLCALDTQTNTVSVITLNRDTLADIQMYSDSGEYVGTKNMQLCLGYAYGDGKHTSCEHMVTNVSRLLCNVPISLYASIDQEAVEIINDMVGGVEVPEYSSDGKTKTGNSITLHGHDAFTYVEARDIQYFDSNLGRVSRQKDYVTAFANKAIQETKKNISLPVSIYNTVTDYMVTNVKLSQVSYIATNYIDMPLTFKTYSIDGSLTEFEGHAALKPDMENLFNTVLEVFYIKVN